MAFDYGARLSRAADAAGTAGVDALIVAPGPDLLYLVGYDPPPLERLTALVVAAGSAPILLVPELERPRAEASAGAPILEIATWRDGQDPYATVARILARGGGGGGPTFGISDRTWASHLIGLQAAVGGASFVPGSGVLSGLRARKDPEELELLARAGRAADDAFAELCREPLAGRSERQVAGILAELLLEAGHESVAFTIVAAGPDGASPHHEPAGREIRPGDAVVLDFGGRVGGYCSDVTRTVSVGEPDSRVRDVHEVVRAAQDAAFSVAGPGVAAQEVDRAARSVIEQAGHGEGFVHRTGHGIGLEEHEDPYIVEGNDRELDAGMCFSIEPGIYLPGRFGVRIEDIVAVTTGGVVRLNNAPRDLTVVA